MLYTDHISAKALAVTDLRDEPCIEGFERIEVVSDLAMLSILMSDLEIDEYEPTQADLDSFHEFSQLEAA